VVHQPQVSVQHLFFSTDISHQTLEEPAGIDQKVGLRGDLVVIHRAYRTVGDAVAQAPGKKSHRFWYTSARNQDDRCPKTKENEGSGYACIRSTVADVCRSRMSQRLNGNTVSSFRAVPKVPSW